MVRNKTRFCASFPPGFNGLPRDEGTVYHVTKYIVPHSSVSWHSASAMTYSQDKRNLSSCMCKWADSDHLLVLQCVRLQSQRGNKSGYHNLCLFKFLLTPGWSPAYLFEDVFVKCACIWRASVFFQFYGVLSGVIYNYSPPPPPPPPPHTHTHFYYYYY